MIKVGIIGCGQWGRNHLRVFHELPNVDYPSPVHLLDAYKHLGLKLGSFPVAEKCAKEVLSLPMHPHLTEEQIRFVCQQINDFFK